MIEIIDLHWVNKETVELTATDGTSKLNFGLYSRHELGWLAEYFRDLAHELEA